MHKIVKKYWHVTYREIEVSLDISKTFNDGKGKGSKYYFIMGRF